MNRKSCAWTGLVGLVFLAVVSRGATPAGGRVLEVPLNYASIQEAIDAAQNGDVVSVDPGRYFENINFRGKAILVVAPEGATIDGRGGGPCAEFRNAEGRDSILEGFELTRGSGALLFGDRYGGAIACSGGASPTIRNNHIHGNRATFGAGMASLAGSPWVEGNLFELNLRGELIATSGGALYLEGPSDPVIVGNRFEENRAMSLGAALTATHGADGRIEDNDFVANSVGPTNFGGALAILQSSPTITANRIVRNQSTLDGGGILLIDSLSTVERNEITDNFGARTGGGICCSGATAPVIRHNQILRNRASTGGGIACESGSRATIADNRIHENKRGPAPFDGGAGIAVLSGSAVIVARNEITENLGVRGGGILVSESTVRSIRNKIIGNLVTVEGGGIHSESSTLIVESTIIACNSAPEGGGIKLNEGSADIVNATISSNSASETRGGGLHAVRSFSGDVRVASSIIWGNDAPTDPEIAEGLDNLQLRYCDVRGGFRGEGNFDSDPRFVSVDENDFRIRLGSPCIDAGDDNATGIGSKDVEGDTRILDGDFDAVARIDVGADEVSPVAASLYGTVGAAGDSLGKVLSVNGSTGGRFGKVDVAAGERILIEMASPPAGPSPARFVLYAVPELPDASTLAVQPFGLGVAPFSTPLNPGHPQPAIEIWNNFGRESMLGVPTLPSSPAPSIVRDRRGTALPRATQATFFGFIQDHASEATVPVSLTNGIVLRIVE